jgi:predicted GNAT family acetyltransferase
MDIKRIQEGSSGQFEAVSEGKQAGLMTYSQAGKDKIIIDHTEVNRDFNGQGVGKKLVMAAVDFARSEGIKIMPLCPFAKSVFQKDASIEDVWFK